MPDTYNELDSQTDRDYYSTWQRWSNIVECNGDYNYFGHPTWSQGDNTFIGCINADQIFKQYIHPAGSDAISRTVSSTGLQLSKSNDKGIIVIDLEPIGELDSSNNIIATNSDPIYLYEGQTYNADDANGDPQVYYHRLKIYVDSGGELTHKEEKKLFSDGDKWDPDWRNADTWTSVSNGD